MMGLMNKIKSGDKLLYVIGEFSSDQLMNGRKKLMKIMFFLEHFSLETGKLVPEKLFSDNEFIMYRFGPFSFDVSNSLTTLKKEGLVEENEKNMHIIAELTERGIEKKRDIEGLIDQKIKDRIDKIKKKFGNKTSKELEDLSLKYLKIKPEEKGLYMGNPISVIISENEAD